MDITLSFTDLLQAAGAFVVPVAGYLGFIQKRITKVELKLPTEIGLLADRCVAKTDYKDDLTDIKDLMREMRGDIKAILGVPPQ